MVCICISILEATDLHLNRLLEPLKKRTHVAIWKWVQKYASFQDRFRVKKNMIKEIFVDETL